MLGAALALAGCEQQWEEVKKVDWMWQWDHYNQPAWPGTLIDRKAPPISIRAAGPYPGPLSEPTPPFLTADLIDQVVAEPFRSALTVEARASLAQASEIAASAATGLAIAWKAPDAAGSVMPARDVYRSHRGRICRDLRQQLERPEGAQAVQITLCHSDLGDNRIVWLPGSPD